MATRLDLPRMRSCPRAWCQIWLLLSILCSLPVYAVGEETTNITTVSEIERTESVVSNDIAEPEADIVELPTQSSEPEPTPSPVIVSESTNNAHI